MCLPPRPPTPASLRHLGPNLFLPPPSAAALWSQLPAPPPHLKLATPLRWLVSSALASVAFDCLGWGAGILCTPFLSLSPASFSFRGPPLPAPPSAVFWPPPAFLVLLSPGRGWPVSKEEIASLPHPQQTVPLPSHAQPSLPRSVCPVLSCPPLHPSLGRLLQGWGDTPDAPGGGAPLEVQSSHAGSGGRATAERLTGRWGFRAPPLRSRSSCQSPFEKPLDHRRSVQGQQLTPPFPSLASPCSLRSPAGTSLCCRRWGKAALESLVRVKSPPRAQPW